MSSASISQLTIRASLGYISKIDGEKKSRSKGLMEYTWYRVDRKRMFGRVMMDFVVVYGLKRKTEVGRALRSSFLEKVKESYHLQLFDIS